MARHLNALLLVALLVATASAIRPCPHPLRMVVENGVRIPRCDPVPIPLPTRKPPTPRPRPPGSITIKSPSIKILNSHDGFLRGCADPRVYFLYARVIPGQAGSTITKNLGHVDYGNGRCDGKFIRKLGGVANDRLPTNRVAVAAYVAIGIEEDDAGDSQVRREVEKQRGVLAGLLRGLESQNLSPTVVNIALNNEFILNSQFKIPEIKKPSDGFLGLGHDFVGFNGLLLVSGSNYPGGQPAVCSRKEFPVCVAKDLFKGLVVGGKVDKNEWRVDVSVDIV